jgi:hypothetical protein
MLAVVEKIAAYRPRVAHLSTLLWLLLALGGIRAALILFHGGEALTIPYATSRIEAFVLNGAQRFASGEAIYLGLDAHPYIIHVYNPLTYLPAGFLGRLFGLDINGVLLSGRLVSYLATLLLAASLALWLRRSTGRWRYGLLVGVGIFFYQTFAATDFFRLRPEEPALLFTFLGVLAFLSGQRYRLAISAGLLFIAFLFKQPFISAPVAVCLYLLLTKEFRAAAVFVAIMGGLLLVFYAGGYWLTQGRLPQNTLEAMANNVITPFESLALYAPIVWHRAYGLVAATPVALWVLLRLWPKHRFWLIYFGVCLLWTFITAGKQGASDNYFSELTILSLVMVALTLAERETTRPALAGVFLLAALSSQVLADGVRDGFLSPPLKIQFEDKVADLSPYMTRYRSLPGDNLILHEKIAVEAGNPVGLDWYLLDILSQQGRIDLTPIFTKIARGEYAHVVFNQRPLCQLEVRLFEATKNGPYRRTYADQVVSEWVRLPQARTR